jgi:hypothetical protein
MMYDLHNAPVSDLSSVVTIDWLAPLRDTRVDPGALLDRVAAGAEDFREQFRAVGSPALVETLTARWTNPGTKPTFVHRHITHRRLATA